ncbi:MAG: hypothetical protein J7L22_04025 [Candidatus Marinimicrobia bacterium]|nr:hypothetical protein [Candidatus Neomarinimicrobiota bacterium]
MKSKIYFLLLFGCLGAFMFCHLSQPANWVDVINDHLQMYPKMLPDDIYKLVYQGMLGPGHLGTERLRIENYLKQELSSVEPDADADLEEVISPDSLYIRINLKKMKAMGLSEEMLVNAIIRSVKKAPHTKSEFIRTWRKLVQMVESDKIRIDKQNFSEFNTYIIENNYPVVHHSEIYKQTYTPSYRVVLRSVWESCRESK